MDLECQSLGNHEFDEAVDGVIPFIRNLTSPVLAANLILNDVPELVNETNLYNSIVIVKKDVKIGIIGYLTPETKFLAPKNKVQYEEEVVAIRREVNKLKNQGINILIALGHSGFIKDLEIAREVEDLDLVIGGHSNTFLWNRNTTEIPEYPQGPYPTVVEQRSGRKVLVVQAYAYTKYMGRLNLIFDSNGEIIEYDGTPILLNQEMPRDPELLEIVNKYRNDVNRISNEVVGISQVFLNGDGCRLRECNMGNFITDSMLNYTRKYYSDVNIAVVQGGRIRASISHLETPFKLTRGDWITVLPFTDSLTIVTMNGTVLLQTLEHSVDTWRLIDSTGQFLQFSGMEVIYDLSKPPGSRVIKAKAVCSNCDEHKLSDIRNSNEYKLLMSAFLADSGDGYKIFENLQKETLSYNEMDCILDYVHKYSPINPKTSGRITILNEEDVEPVIDVISKQNKTRDGRSSSSSSKIDKSFSLYFVLIFVSVIYQYSLPIRI